MESAMSGLSKLVVFLAITGLAVMVCAQRMAITRLEQRMDAFRKESRSMEISLARTEGAYAGLQTTAYHRLKSMYGSLSSHEQMVAELRETVKDKEHLIQSLENGQTLTITAYSAEPGQTDDTPFTTANNNRVRDGIVAVSRDLFSKGWVFGRKVYVVDMGVYTIDDLMHQRKKNQIDIFMFDTAKALKFGRKKMRVYLLGT